MKWIVASIVLGAVVFLAAGSALAQDSGGEHEEMTMWYMLKASGIVGLFIILMSFVAVALIVEHFITIRRQRLIPLMLAQQVDQLLASKQYQAAQQSCEASNTFLGKVVAAGLKQVGGMFGFFDMQSAMQEASEREVSRLYRKIEYLAFIAASAPMLGLLGTVTGMIISFNQIAATEGAAKPSQLAYGISQALVTTFEGLVVAIPVMYFVSHFRNRVDSLVAEAETIVEKLMGRFRTAGQ